VLSRASQLRLLANRCPGVEHSWAAPPCKQTNSSNNNNNNSNSHPGHQDCSAPLCSRRQNRRPRPSYRPATPTSVSPPPTSGCRRRLFSITIVFQLPPTEGRCNSSCSLQHRARTKICKNCGRNSRLAVQPRQYCKLHYICTN